MSSRRNNLSNGADRDGVADREDDAQAGEQDFGIQRTWEDIEEIDGNLIVTGISEAEKRKRLLKDTTPLQRGIIRHLILILDLSLSTNEKDLRPTRYHLTLLNTKAFIREYFEQNPISQLGIIAMRNGVAEPISDMSGNPTEHIKAVDKQREPANASGQPSLENALEMARAALFHAPSHGTREILLIMSALHSVDPGDVHKTIDSLVADKINAKVIGLAAQVAICRELTNTPHYALVTHGPAGRDIFAQDATPKFVVFHLNVRLVDSL
ncbi:hypothetical protein LTS08_000181 [Lithohypha guttulata]|uniref:uncharacterized protein n=1 Tax=Lithohypha guttulata TaxID=1690604 RepID=UPI002DDE7069|nr:hypothetical protein LTR51_007194 [Lithohypha guttulata]KAK5106065.1 hypothetical protein LTS08_000181 [Lithohypha guttulata]